MILMILEFILFKQLKEMRKGGNVEYTVAELNRWRAILAMSIMLSNAQKSTNERPEIFTIL